MTRAGVMLRAVAFGVALGGGVGLVWRHWAALKVSLVANLPGSTMVAGGLAAVIIGLGWLAFARLPVRINSIKLSLSGAEVQISPHDAPMLWRFFLELASRIALQPLGDKEGLVEEALNSYYRLFDHARNDLAARAPALRTGEAVMSPQAYALQILNSHIRPLLARWHPRLERWKRTGMPEHLWPLESLCRQDIEATRRHVLAAAWDLGAALKIAGIDQLLPPRPTAPFPALVSDAELTAAEAALPVEGEAARRQIGWKIFVEASCRLPSLAITANGPAPRDAFREAANSLADRLRQDLTTLPPVIPPLTSGSLETAVLRLIHRLVVVSARPDLNALDDMVFRTTAEALHSDASNDLQAIAMAIGWRR